MEKSTLVLGASENTSRYSNKAIRKLRAQNIETYAIGARDGKVLDVVITTEKQLFKGLNTISLYLNKERQKEYYDYIITLKPERVIFNPGTENTELISLLKKAKIKVEVACTLVLLSTNQY